MSGPTHAVAIPKWGIEMENGTITGWHHELGETVAKGEALVDIESDKIVNTLEATATGVLRRKFVESGETLDVGKLIAIIADANVSEESIESFAAEFNAEFKKNQGNTTTVPESSPAVAPAPDAATAPAPDKVRVSPPVRRKAEQLGVDTATVMGSGPAGRILLEDVERAAHSKSSCGQQAKEQSGSEDIARKFTVRKLNNTQQTTGRRLVESKQSVPHFYLNIDIELDQLLAERENLNADQSQKVSINDMIVWCTARALKAVPEINAQLLGDEVRQFEHADISVAVATDRGLLTPIVKAVDKMRPVEVAKTMAGLIDKAKNGGLAREDIVGGSFTISNLGMYAVNRFNAIINPPQVAILALGQAQKQVVVRERDEIEVATVLSANLSSDHRVIDGALGGKFLRALKREIESL